MLTGSDKCYISLKVNTITCVIWGQKSNRLLTKERSRTSETRYYRRTNNWQGSMIKGGGHWYALLLAFPFFLYSFISSFFLIVTFLGWTRLHATWIKPERNSIGIWQNKQLCHDTPPPPSPSFVTIEGQLLSVRSPLFLIFCLQTILILNMTEILLAGP
jgi:hypothetical protein